MFDERLTPSNGRIASIDLKGLVKAEKFVVSKSGWVKTSLADLRESPLGKRRRQLQYGTGIEIFEKRSFYSFVQCIKDGYVGYLRNNEITTKKISFTHLVKSNLCHVYENPDIKSRASMVLTLGAKVSVSGETKNFFKIDEGWIYKNNLSSKEKPYSQPLDVATSFLGAPYLWGGNSVLGIDCSGLVQLSCHMCGIKSAADSDLQEKSLGQSIELGQDYQRGDLLFWKGHVAWVSSPSQLIHATAFHMAVVVESLEEVFTRILKQGGGKPTSLRRL